MKVLKNNIPFPNETYIGHIITTIKNKKKFNIPNSRILDNGKYPVISQDKKNISGYSDEESFVLDSSEESPYLVFGDHTCIIKNIKFPFIIGADGTQVFSVNNDIVLNDFLYYYILSGIPIYQKGYKRHFSELKEKKISHPDIKTQQNIVNFLDMQKKKLTIIQTLISKMEQRNQYYFDKIFFGDIRFDDNGEMYDNTDWKDITINGYKKQIPNQWSISKLENVVRLDKGVNIPTSELNYDDGVQYLRSGDIWEKASSRKDNIYYSGNDLKKVTYKSKDDWIICFDGYNTNPFNGTIGLVTNQGVGTLSGRLYKIKGFEDISLEFANIALLQSIYMKNIFFRFSEGSMSKSVTKHAKKFEFPLIPMDEQIHIDKFARNMLKEVDLVKELYSKEKQVFQWLCEKLVSGEYKIED